nr:NAD(+) diphosphatase [Deinobacterium chartae]
MLEERSTLRLPTQTDLEGAGLLPTERYYIGRLGPVPCYTAAWPKGETLPGGARLEHLRAVFAQLGAERFAVAGRAAQILHFEDTHRFCGRCGAVCAPLEGERARACSRCGLVAYPRLSPAVIVRIERDGELLLARGRNTPPGMFSTLAGFVEPGESLEAAVHREVREEVGLALRDLRYFGSQPWPFPHSLMVAFTACYAGGELRPDPAELLEARWFRPDALPEIAGPISIARTMIDDFVRAHSVTGR